MYVLGLQETLSQQTIGKLCIFTLSDKIVMAIQDGHSTCSTSIWLLPDDAVTVINYIKIALSELECDEKT